MKAVVLIPVLVLGLTWTFQGVPAEEVERPEAPTNAAAEKLANEVCNAPPAAGSGPIQCFGYFRNYFYNSTSKSCELFIYGGCGGNQNRFESEKACLKECDPNEFCKAPPMTGPCEAAIPRYFYNTTAKSCEIFTYGGCSGNQNNFKTEASCLEKCHHEDEA